MRITYVPPSEKAWQTYYLQTGSGYRGLPYQRGYGLGSVLGSLFRSILPVGKKVLKTVGKQALVTGAQIASDALAGRNVGEAAKEHARSGAGRLIHKAVKHIKPPTAKKRKRRKPTQKGKGLGKRGTKKRTRKAPSKKGKKKKIDQLGTYYDV
jgi:hypothetical protein